MFVNGVSTQQVFGKMIDLPVPLKRLPIFLVLCLLFLYYFSHLFYFFIKSYWTRIIERTNILWGIRFYPISIKHYQSSFNSPKREKAATLQNRERTAIIHHTVL